MLRQTAPVLMGLLLLVLGTGCLGSFGKCSKCCHQVTAPVPPPPPPALPLVARGDMEMLFQGLPQLVPNETILNSAPEGLASYLGLTPKECQCLAARCCPVANLMDRERQTLVQQANTKCMCLVPKKQLMGTGFLQEMLESAAQEARDQQSGAALELYYRLAEAEAALDLLNVTIKELDSTVAKGKELKDKDLATNEEYEKLERQLFKSLGDRVELLMNIERVNIELGKLICIKACPGEVQFWPLVDLDANCCEINVDGAIEVALATRGELKVLRTLQRDLTLLTLPAARGYMRSINGLLGSAEPRSKCPQLQTMAEMFCNEGPFSIELADRRDQLCWRIAQRETEIAADVREEARQASRRCQTAALAKKRSDSLLKMVREVEERRTKELAVAADVTKARLEWFQARGDVVKEIAARERARAKVRQHQGVLPLECPEADSPPGSDSAPPCKKCCAQ